MMARITWASVLLVVACSKTSGPSAVQKDGEAGLRELFVRARTACQASDVATGRAIVASLMPTRDQLRRALVDTAPDSVVEMIVAQAKEIPTDDAKAACVLSPPGRTEIAIHRATTEEIAARSARVVVDEFPRGTQSLSPLLRPGTTFYEVETVEPGADKGTKFHLLFWDGTQWRMLGPAWRYVGAATEP